MFAAPHHDTSHHQQNQKSSNAEQYAGVSSLLNIELDATIVSFRKSLHVQFFSGVKDAAVLISVGPVLKS